MDKLIIIITLLITALNVNAQSDLKLDKHHLLLDGALSNNEIKKQPFVFNDLRKAVASFSDTTTLYVRPYVYWVDNPNEPEVVKGKNGKEPFGMVIHGKKLHFIGLGKRPEDVVFASKRGHMQGAVGNFTMLDIHANELIVENMTLGNYCNVDLEYTLLPELSVKKRSNAITQAHVGYVHGQKLYAKKVRFISRLNLNPLNGAQNSIYDSCHFECTDDALNGTALYRHCNFDLYGQKPFWSTFGHGAMFVDCDFNVKSNNREMFFCKQGGPVTIIDSRYHAPSDSIYIGWTAYPQPWLRCYQRNFTLNGKPYLIGSRQSSNTIVLDSITTDITHAPYLAINKHEAQMQVGGKPINLTVKANGHKVTWNIPSPYHQFIKLNQVTDESVTISTICESPEEPLNIPVTAYTTEGVAVCQLTILPTLLPPPTIKKKPSIIIKKGVAMVEYDLDLQGRRDRSKIWWKRQDNNNCSKNFILAYSNDKPNKQYHLRPGDVGKQLVVEIQPAHHRSNLGETIKVVSRVIKEQDLSNIMSIETDFSDLWCGWSQTLMPDTWQVGGYKPQDTSSFDWKFDAQKPMWEYGEGFNGAVGKGLLQAQRGARIMYTPVGRTYGDMMLTLQVDPTKTAGQGFGSASGQYMDICLKFDTRTLTGYGLRIIRTTKHSKAVDFLLVSYNNGIVTALTEPVSATCYRTGCTIFISYTNGLLNAHVETTTPKPSESTLPHQINLQTRVPSNIYGGIHIQHTGSCGESTTMLHHLKTIWQ